MILTMTHQFDMLDGRYSILSDGERHWWVMEREWLFNKRGKSCVPRDEYTLDPHSSNKYPDTWALVGDGVSHYETEGVPRSACVMHAARQPSHLEGCFAPCRGVTANGQTIDSTEAVEEVRQLLKSASTQIRVLMQC